MEILRTGVVASCQKFGIILMIELFKNYQNSKLTTPPPLPVLLILKRLILIVLLALVLFVEICVCIRPQRRCAQMFHRAKALYEALHMERQEREERHIVVTEHATRRTAESHREARGVPYAQPIHVPKMSHDVSNFFSNKQEKVDDMLRSARELFDLSDYFHELVYESRSQLLPLQFGCG